MLKSPLRTLTSLAAVAAFAVPSVAFAQTQITISNDDPGTWGFFEEIPVGTGQLIESEITPPLGTGSLNMTVDDTGRMLFGTFDFVGVFLDQFLYLEYSTYQTPSSTASDSAAISLQFNIDYDLTDGDDTTWQGRLVFEPANNPDQGTVTKGVWQDWQPDAGKWWMTGVPVIGGVAEPGIAFPQSSPGSFDDIIAAFPNAGLRNLDGALFFKAGGPTPGFNGDVDKFVVNVSGDEWVFDFEASDAPDSDGDGVPDDEDECPDSDLSPTVWVNDCDTGVENFALGGGCTLADFVQGAFADAKNHGKFVSAIATALTDPGIITSDEHSAIVRCAKK